MKSLPHDNPHVNEEATLRQPNHEDASQRHGRRRPKKDIKSKSGVRHVENKLESKANPN